MSGIRARQRRKREQQRVILRADQVPLRPPMSTQKMATFDALPKLVREALSSARFSCWNPFEASRLLRGYSPEVLAKQYQEADDRLAKERERR